MDTKKEFMGRVFDEAGSQSPYLYIKTEKCPLLAALITTGLWADIGQTTAMLQGKEPEPTFEARGSSSRIDMAFGNQELMRFVRGYEVLTVFQDGIALLCPIKVVLVVACPRAFALQTKNQPLPPKHEKDLYPVDVQHLEEEILERYVGAFEEAVNSQDVNLIWDVWTAMAEAFLLERTTLGTGNEIFVQSNRFREREHAASTRKVRLVNRGRQFEGVEMHPEKRGCDSGERWFRSPTSPEPLGQNLPIGT